MDIHSKIIVCTTLDADGKVVRKDNFENSFQRLQEYISLMELGDIFIMESTGFYEPIFDFIESHGFSVKLVNHLKVRLIAKSRKKNDDVDSEGLSKLLKNAWIPELYVPAKFIREMRRIVRSRIQLKRHLTRMKNCIHFELLRLHVDYEVNIFTWKGMVFLHNLGNPRMLSELSVMDSIESDTEKIDSDLGRYSARIA